MSMKANFEQTCKVCKTKIKKGDTIHNVNGYWCINVNCKPPGATAQTEAKNETKPETSNTITPNGPFEESEIIVRWAMNKAHKIVFESINDIRSLSTQELNSMGQKEGMVTKALIDTTLKLFEINGIKSAYYEPGKKVNEPKV